jgi:hypothetical protein
VLTSDNPMSVPVTPHANMLRRGVLALELRNAGLVHRPVNGRNADGSWQEHGFAVAAGIGESDALAELRAERVFLVRRHRVLDPRDDRPAPHHPASARTESAMIRGHAGKAN